MVLTSVLIKVLVSVRAFSGIVALTGGTGSGLLVMVSLRLSDSSQAFALARHISQRSSILDISVSQRDNAPLFSWYSLQVQL